MLISRDAEEIAQWARFIVACDEPRAPCDICKAAARRILRLLGATDETDMPPPLSSDPHSPMSVVCPTCRQNPGWSCVTMRERIERHDFHASRRRAVRP